MSKMSELAAASDLADLIKGQASAMNQTMMNGYDAGLQEGFRRGIQAAADLLDKRGPKESALSDALLEPDKTLVMTLYWQVQDVLAQIRALKP